MNDSTDDVAPVLMNIALLDDLRRQNLALKVALNYARNNLGDWMHHPVHDNLRREWALLMGEEE